MRVPLAVRLDGPLGSTYITDRISDLRMRNTSPGGFASVELVLSRAMDASLLATFSDLLVFDAATGEQCGGGRLLDQGRMVDGARQVWAISALGEGLASMQDREEPYYLIDSGYEQWEQRSRNRRRLSVAPGVAPKGGNSDDALLMSVEDGNVSTGSSILAIHRGGIITGQLLGGIGYTHDSGSSSASRYVRARAYSSDVTTFTTAREDTWSTTTSPRRTVVASTDFPSSRAVAAFNWYFGGSDFTADDNTWSAIYAPRVSALRLDRARQPILGSAYANDFVRVDEAFIDLVARFCPRLDLANARIDSGTQDMDQLAWYDGITPLEVCEDLIAQEAGFTWHVWEQVAAASWRTEFITLPIDVRYEASIVDGYDAPSPTSEIYDRVNVRYKDAKGRDRNTVRTQTLPDLQAAGVTRSKTLDQGSEVRSATGSVQAAENFLAAHRSAPNGGVLTIARPIRDGLSGRWIPPWRIRSGELIRIRGIQATPDTFNTPGVNGLTVARIVAVTFSEVTGSAELELDVPTLTEQRALAKLMTARTRRQ